MKEPELIPSLVTVVSVLNPPLLRKLGSRGRERVGFESVTNQIESEKTENEGVATVPNL